MAEEILRRNLDRAFDPGPGFPHPAPVSRTMQAVGQDVVSFRTRPQAELPGWLLPLVAALILIVIVAIVIGANLLRSNSIVPVRSPRSGGIAVTRTDAPRSGSPAFKA